MGLEPTPLLGIYTPGDGADVIGGKNGEGKATGFFVVRIRIPKGFCAAIRLACLRGWRRTSGADVTAPNSYR